MSWHQGQLKHWLERNDSGVWGDDPDGIDDVDVLRSTDIRLDGGWQIEDPARRKVTARDRLLKTLVEGDLVVVTSSGSELHLGKTAIVDHKVAQRRACFANFVQRLTPRSTADSRYVRYVLSSTRASEEMATLGNTTTGLRNLNGGVIGSVTFPGPPIEEQRAIADYLDAETACIDALIAKKQQLIHLLEERRRTELERLLWSGLTTRLKFVAELLPGYAFPSSDFGAEEKGPRLLRGTNVGVGSTSWTDEVRLSSDALGRHPVDRYRVVIGDLVVGMDRPFIKAGTRVAAIGEADDCCLLVQRVCRLRPLLADKWVLQAAVASRRFETYVQSDLTGVSVPHLSDEQLGDFLVPVGLTAADEDAVRGLLHGQGEIEARLEEQIDLLSERRQALITAAVTGEFQVPGAA